MTEPVFIIAEAGVNHNGDLELGRQLIDAAEEAGADAVKFQTFLADDLVSVDTPKAAYQQRTTDASESHHAMIRSLELTEGMHEALIDHASKRGIRFMSTPFDTKSLQMLTQRFGLELIKIGSGELTNLPFLVEAARLSRFLILSTGMGTLGEVEQALAAIAFGLTNPVDSPPSGDDLTRAFGSDEGLAALRERVTVLHCTTQYPAPLEGVNLHAMTTLAAAFGLAVGYSDHTVGTHIPVAAVACGASVIEKHLTLDRGLPGPDHTASLEPSDFRSMVSQIRDIEQVLGDGVKRPVPSEWPNRAVARKSLVAARAISAGEAFSPENLTCKRPGTGKPPRDFWAALGERATRDYAEDELVQ